MQTTQRTHAAGEARGFTLIELLVTIAVIAILAAMLLPVVGKAKAKGQAVVCLNHHRQLALAWLLYASDYEDALAYNLGEDEIKRLVADQRYLNWTSTLISWELDSDNTNSALLVAGGIGPYTAGSARLYKCPNDSVLSDLQAGAGWSERVRSISMNAMVGDAGEFSTDGTNVNNPHYRQFFRLGQIPEPSNLFVFIEEHPDSINDGYFLNKPYSGEWNDLPASWHDNGANLAYADGHVETHHWLAASTRRPARPAGAKLPFPVPEEERADFVWLLERTSIKGFNTP